MEGNVATFLHFYETQRNFFPVLRIMKNIAVFLEHLTYQFCEMLSGSVFTF